MAALRVETRIYATRIYAVVAETVDTPSMGVVTQIPGRMAAQAGHALSRMRMHLQLNLFRRYLRKAEHRALGKKTVEEILVDLLKSADEGITTIHLSCRDSKELQHVSDLLHKAFIQLYCFRDTNPAVYGAGEVITAIATVPVLPKQVEGILDYLPLWTPK